MTGRPANRSATIYDIARECGVAPSTVSRAFSRPGRVSQATGERIRAAAARLGYRTDPPARAVPAGRSATVALLVSDVTNPVYFDIIRGVEVTAAGAGLTTLLADTRESSRFERQALDWAVPAAEALVLGSPRLPDSAIRAGPPPRPAGKPHAGGQRHPPAGILVRHRPRPRHGAAARGMGPGPATVRAWTEGGRHQGAGDAADRLVSVYLSNREGPIGSTHPVRLLVKVPREVDLALVVGFDNIFGSDFCTPALTTVAAPLRSLGTRAVEHLVAQLGGAPARTGTAMVLPVRLVVRDSTAQRRRKRTSPAWGTTRVSGSSTQPSRSTSAGSR